MTNYIIVGENEKIILKPSQTADIKGFAFTPISRCIAIFAKDTQGNFLVAHIDPFTNLDDVNKLFDGFDVAHVKMIYNPFAQYGEKERDDVGRLLIQKFSSQLETITLKKEGAETGSDSLNLSIDLSGKIDQKIEIFSDHIDGSDDQYGISHPHNFARLNTISEGLLSTLCHYNQTRKPLREVGTLSAAYEKDIYEALISRDVSRNFPKSQPKYPKYGGEKEILAYEIEADKFRLKEVLQEILQDETALKSWQGWLEKNHDKEKHNAAEEIIATLGLKEEASQIRSITAQMSDNEFIKYLQEQSGQEDILSILKQESGKESLVNIKESYEAKYEYCAEVGDGHGIERCEDALRYISILEKRNLSSETPKTSPSITGESSTLESPKKMQKDFFEKE